MQRTPEKRRGGVEKPVSPKRQAPPRPRLYRARKQVLRVQSGRAAPAEGAEQAQVGCRMALAVSLAKVGCKRRQVEDKGSGDEQRRALKIMRLDSWPSSVQKGMGWMQGHLANICKAACFLVAWKLMWPSASSVHQQRLPAPAQLPAFGSESPPKISFKARRQWTPISLTAFQPSEQPSNTPAATQQPPARGVLDSVDESAPATDALIELAAAADGLDRLLSAEVLTSLDCHPPEDGCVGSTDGDPACQPVSAASVAAESSATDVPGAAAPKRRVSFNLPSPCHQIQPQQRPAGLPRRRPSTAAHRPALPEQAPGDGVEQDYREAYINQKLCRHWQAGARWAALDFDGLEFGLAKVAFHRAAYSKAAGVLLSHKGKAGAEALLATVEAEWQQLKALRQRFAALPLTTDKDEEWSDAGQECRPHTPFPKSILKQRPPAHQLHEGPTREPSLNTQTGKQCAFRQRLHRQKPFIKRCQAPRTCQYRGKLATQGVIRASGAVLEHDTSTTREFSAFDRVKVLSEALPYLQRFRGKTIVIKYGGAAMKDPTLKAGVVNDLVLLSCVGIRCVLVHGGGPEINIWLNKLGIEAQFKNGLRVTDGPTMDVVEMVLGGRVNKGLVTLIQQAGGTAVGLCGKDSGIIRARQMVEKDIGFVGDITGVDASILKTLVLDGYTPVVASVAADQTGQALNVNADIAAGEIAAALQAEKLILMTDVPGVLRDKDDISTKFVELDIRQTRELVDDGIIAGGMIPKVECCVRCLAQGVNATHIIDGRQPHSLLMELLTDVGVGTMIVG
ncbi:hypothetical protein WJX72_000394 [[Myrmecia] bisecta]|uniref:acetylglutamate kinase n=1 Tax=[Myrmecia] bisecta TaxID=41462 RepID=A0AAW1PN70_9CHLO